MTDLFEVTAQRLAYKFYTDAGIDPEVDPGSTGGQVLRHRDSPTLSMTKEGYTADEIRTDKQQPMSRDGTRRVPITIPGLLSCLTQADLFEAVLGGTWSATPIEITETEVTSIAAAKSTSKFIFASGDPVASGLRVGHMFRLTDASEAANNAMNFVVLGFGGTGNRDITVFPEPADMSADTGFTLTTVGGRVFIPSTGHVKRKMALELNNADADLSRLITEARLSGFTFTAAPDANVQIDFTGLGRNRKIFDGADAPFFTAPTAETTTDVISSMDGLLRLNGETIGITTGLNFTFNRAPTAPAQMNRKGLTAGILLANAVGSGSFTVFLKDRTFYDLFDDPETMKATEFELLAYMPASDIAASPAMTFYLPRCKIGSNNETTIEGAKALECSFAFARYIGNAPGVESTSIQICDTEVLS